MKQLVLFVKWIKFILLFLFYCPPTNITHAHGMWRDLNFVSKYSNWFSFPSPLFFWYSETTTQIPINPPRHKHHQGNFNKERRRVFLPLLL